MAISSDGTFMRGAVLEPLLFPRFTVEERMSANGGCAAITKLLCRVAFQDFASDTPDVYDIDWMGDVEAVSLTIAALDANLPPVQILHVGESPGACRVTLAQWLRQPAIRGVHELSELNIIAALSASPHPLLRAVYAHESDGRLVLSMLSSLRQAADRDLPLQRSSR